MNKTSLNIENIFRKFQVFSNIKLNKLKINIIIIVLKNEKNHLFNKNIILYV